MILNPDSVFPDATLRHFYAMEQVESRIVRTPSDTICLLLQENVDLFAVEGDTSAAIEQIEAEKNHVLGDGHSGPHLRRRLHTIMSAFERQTGTPSEGTEACHSRKCSSGRPRACGARELPTEEARRLELRGLHQARCARGPVEGAPEGIAFAKRISGFARQASLPDVGRCLAHPPWK